MLDAKLCKLGDGGKAYVTASKLTFPARATNCAARLLNTKKKYKKYKFRYFTISRNIFFCTDEKLSIFDRQTKYLKRMF